MLHGHEGQLNDAALPPGERTHRRYGQDTPDAPQRSPTPRTLPPGSVQHQSACVNREEPRSIGSACPAHGSPRREPRGALIRPRELTGGNRKPSPPHRQNELRPPSGCHAHSPLGLRLGLPEFFSHSAFRETCASGFRAFPALTVRGCPCPGGGVCRQAKQGLRSTVGIRASGGQDACSERPAMGTVSPELARWTPRTVQQAIITSGSGQARAARRR